MYKELPFFKFNPTEWLTGKISFQSLEIQGAFIQCCCLFWKNSGILKVDNIDWRIGKENLNTLIEYDFIDIDDDNFVRIEFLEEQLVLFEGVRKTRAENGSKGGIANAIKKLAFATNTVANDEQNVADKDIRLKNNILLNNSLLSEIKISDDKKLFLINNIEIEIEENYLTYFKISIGFQKLFIKNLKEKKSPYSQQKNAKFKNYVNPIRLMIEKEEATLDQLREAHKYLDSIEGDFWKSNILSTDALRKQISKLLAKKNTKYISKNEVQIQNPNKRNKF
jgi:hypothetical protein